MKSLLVLFVVVGYFATGEAVQCYQCDSVLNPKCGMSIDKSVNWTTTNKPDGCFCTKSVLVTASKTYVNRGCILKMDPSHSRSNLPVVNGSSFVSLSIYGCNQTELCNGTNSITAALATSMILAMVSIFMSWK